MSAQANTTLRARQLRRCIANVLPAVLLLVGSVSNASPISAANKTADRMLDAIGGRTAWAELRNTINGSVQNRANEPTVVYAVITMDFQKPRFRIETTAQDLHLVRVIDGSRGWRLRRSGEIEDVPESLFEDELRWYGAHLYRTLHRIAARDPLVSLSLDDQDRLQVHAEGERILWLALDAKGEPYAFGAYDDEVGSLSGPWTFEQDGIRHPIWTSSPDGTWRAAIRRLDVNVPLHSQMFARPESGN